MALITAALFPPLKIDISAVWSRELGPPNYLEKNVAASTKLSVLPAINESLLADKGECIDPWLICIIVTGNVG